VVLDAPRPVDWFQAQASDAQARARWLAVGVKLAIVFGAAAIGDWLPYRALCRPRARLASRSSDALPARLVLGLLLLVALVV